MIKFIILFLSELVFLCATIYYSIQSPESYKLLLTDKVMACLFVYLLLDHFFVVIKYRHKIKKLKEEVDSND